MVDPKHDLPDGTLYLPALRSAVDVPDPAKLIVDSLRTLGLLTDEA